MGKLQEFEITFDKNKVVYSPGESISGTVTIKVDDPLQCKGETIIPEDFSGWKAPSDAKQGSSSISIT